jgi:hypothetical protein
MVPPPQILVYSILTLRLHRPPAVRLIDTSSSRGSTPSADPASRTSSPPLLSSTTTTASTTPSFSHPRTLESPELLDSLSLSSAPPPIPHRAWHASSGPVFGHASLPLRPAIFAPSNDAELRSRQRRQQDNEEEDDNAMDWTPTLSPVRPSGPVVQQPQIQVPRPVSDATTGLETLLERTNIDSSEPSYAAGAGRRRTAQTRRWWGWVYALSLVPLFSVVYYLVLGGEFFAIV